MKIYDLELSGHAHRARLFANLLGLKFERVPVDLLNGAHKHADYLSKNPFGQVPTIEDGDVTVSDSNAILVYLATQYDEARTWLPTDPAVAAQVHMWLSKAANEQAHGLAAARLVTVFNAALNHELAKEKAYALLTIMNDRLAESDWLVGSTPTIADVALFSYTEHSPEGGVDLSAYSNVLAWLERVRALPGFVPMQATETDAKRALNA